jgi:hypothetical protein
LVLFLATLYALNDVGGTISLRLGQLCGGLLVLGGVVDVVTAVWYGVRGYAVSLVGLVTTCLFMALGWFTLIHLSKRGRSSVEDAAN